MRDIDISLMAVDGSDVLNLVRPVEDGLISRIRVVFDPRPLFPPDTGS